MILYFASKSEFSEDVRLNRIERKVEETFMLRLGRTVGRGEFASWRNSLQYMNNLLCGPRIPDDANIAIEYKIPNSSKRIDFMVIGQTAARRNSVVIIELKQWETVAKTSMDGLVETFVGGGIRTVPHPSYQAWSYASLLNEFNSSVQDYQVALSPCAYLHNCEKDYDLRDPFYQPYLERAPLFLRNDVAKLTEYIESRVPWGDRENILQRIENGKIRPSKNLADNLVEMLKGNPEFVMIDDQKVVYETALRLAAQSNQRRKNILIVEGGPGSGKSVVAVNLLVELNRQQKLSQYVSKNAAPRAVYQEKLAGQFRRVDISSLFVGSGSFHGTKAGYFDALIVDEAHRLNEKSGLFGNLGENQIKELIQCSSFTVFFLDEDQRVTFKDIGSKAEIKKWAKKAGASVTEMELSSQFRCGGSSSYLAWLDDVLQIRRTANDSISTVEYDVQVMNDPHTLKATIDKLNLERNSARIVAGYCWPWNSKTDANASDIVIGNSFKMKWNLQQDGSAWIIQPKSVNQVGCIHTCQGLEVDYIGVIVGPDLVVRDGKIITDGYQRASADQSIKGFKSRMKKDPNGAVAEADVIIKNTYRTLLSRGMKGCRIYATDAETLEYFRTRINATNL